MKYTSWLYLFGITMFALVGCETSSPTIQPTQFEPLLTSTATLRSSTPSPSTTPTPISTLIQSTTPSVIVTATNPTLTISPTPVDTLQPEKANETIKALLQEPIDCAAPCFWGIVPGQTTVDEAEGIFNHFGLSMGITTFEGKKFATTEYDFGNGLSFDVSLTLRNNIVENLQIKMNVENQVAGKAREWLAYSPETLIKRYGTPSRVDFLGSWSPGPYFSMEMYFDAMDLIIEYDDLVLLPKQGSWLVCPLTTQFEGLSLWMGKNPVYPPGEGIQLEKVTSLTKEEFSKLMIGDPKQACFIFNGNLFQ